MEKIKDVYDFKLFIRRQLRNSGKKNIDFARELGVTKGRVSQVLSYSSKQEVTFDTMFRWLDHFGYTLAIVEKEGYYG